MNPGIVTDPRVQRRALPVLVTALGADAGLKVVWGDGASMNGATNTITLPRLPVDASPDIVAMTLGIAYHEVGHKKYTDFGAWGSLRNRREHSIANALEDPRMERRFGQDYAGVAHWLRRTDGIVLASGHARDGSAGPLDAYTMYLYHWVRVNVDGFEELRPALQTAQGHLQQHLDDRAMMRVEGVLATHAAQLASTADAVALAKRLDSILEEIAQEEEQSESGDDASEGASGGSGSGPDNDPSASGGPSQTGQDPESGNSSAAAGGSPADPNGSPNPSGARAILDADPSQEGIGDDVMNAMGALGAACREAPGEKASTDVGSVVSRDLVDVDQPMEGYLAAMESVGAEVGVAQRHLEQLIRSVDRVRKRPHIRGSRLRQGALLKIRQGDARIFERKTKAAAMATAVQVMVDLSGSMSGEDIGTATAATALLAEACHNLTVPCEVLGFMSSLQGVEVSVHKAFGEALVPRTRDQIGRLPEMISGGTVTAPAMMQALTRLVRRKEPRKLLLVITDAGVHDLSACQDLIRMAETAGTEVVGLLIGAAEGAGEEVFTRAEAVDPENIGISVISALRICLMGARARVA